MTFSDMTHEVRASLSTFDLCYIVP